MKILNKATKDQIDNFSDLVEPLVEYIKETWEGELLPKGYRDFTEDTSITDIDISGFKGFLNTSACSLSFPEAVSLPSIAYDDREQGRSPLQMLISSCVSYGMQVQERRNALKEFSNNDLVNIVLTGEHNHVFDKDFVKAIFEIYGELEDLEKGEIK